MAFTPAAILLAAQSAVTEHKMHLVMQAVYNEAHVGVCFPHICCYYRYHVKRRNVHSLSALCIMKSFGSLGHAGSIATVC